MSNVCAFWPRLFQNQRVKQYLCCNVSNLVQPVHHVVKQLQLLVAQAAEIQWSRSFARLDDAGNVLQPVNPSFAAAAIYWCTATFTHVEAVPSALWLN